MNPAIPRAQASPDPPAEHMKMAELSAGPAAVVAL